MSKVERTDINLALDIDGEYVIIKQMRIGNWCGNPVGQAIDTPAGIDYQERNATNAGDSVG